MPTPPTTTPAQTDRDTALRAAYTTAQRQLREAHQDEFNVLRQAAAKALGVEWTPTPTAEQKAAEQVDALLAEFPALKDRLLDQMVVTDTDGKGVPWEDTPTSAL